MKVTDVITLGDKIDIQLSRQAEIEEKGGEKAVVYQSSVCDYLSDAELEIAMPSIGGRMVLFQIGAECSFVFYSKGGMYTCKGIVQQRYRKDGLYLLSVLIKTKPVKFQRREFFRVDYITKIEYYSITEEIANKDTMREVLDATESIRQEGIAGQGNTQDISGGGTRFSSAELLEPYSYLLLTFQLTNDRVRENFQLVAQVISTAPSEKASGLYVNRVSFLFKDLKEQERIVRFVFDEERRIRSKEVG
jgi:c-di-GMP-binding flagellar brake protein YcgR